MFRKYQQNNNILYLAPECPTDFVLAKHEKDGKTCYGLSQSIF